MIRRQAWAPTVSLLALTAATHACSIAYAQSTDAAAATATDAAATDAAAPTYSGPPPYFFVRPPRVAAGIDPNGVHRAVTRAPIQTAIVQCYTTALASNAHAHGVVSVRLEVIAGGIGTIDTVHITPANEPLTDCVRSALGNVEWPNPHGVPSSEVNLQIELFSLCRHRPRITDRAVVKRVGVLTAGGDAPGINPCLKALVYRAHECGIATVGIFDGWEGLLGDTTPEVLDLAPARVRTWDRDGGTHLASSRINPFRLRRDEHKVDASDEVLRNIARLGLDALVVIGGSDSLGVARRMHERGAPVVAVPKSINKEIGRTDYTLGFDTSLKTCADIIERSRTPAGTRRWVQVVEVFGHRAGHLALWSAVAGGAQLILIPEHPFRLERLYQLLDERLRAPNAPGARAPRYATVVVAEGAAPEGGHEITVDATTDDFGHARIGGIGALLAERIRTDSGCDARSVALGHPQRGGAPGAIDRAMGLLFGCAAIDACREHAFGTMVSARGVIPCARMSLVRIADALAEPHTVDLAREYDTVRYFAQRHVPLAME